MLTNELLNRTYCAKQYTYFDHLPFGCNVCFHVLLHMQHIYRYSSVFSPQNEDSNQEKPFLPALMSPQTNQTLLFVLCFQSHMYLLAVSPQHTQMNTQASGQWQLFLYFQISGRLFHSMLTSKLFHQPQQALHQMCHTINTAQLTTQCTDIQDNGKLWLDTQGNTG